MKNLFLILFFVFILPYTCRLQTITSDSTLVDTVIVRDSVFIDTTKTTAEIADSTREKTITSQKSVRLNRQYFKSYYLDTRDIFLSPGQWNRKQWLTFSGLSVSFSLLLRYDDEIQRFAQKNRTTQMDRISANYLEPWGSGYYSMGTMGLFYLYGSLFHKQRMQKVALLGVKTYIISGILVHLPKNLLGRHRPYQDNPPNPYSWNGFLGGRAFVSGHTTSIWSVATIVASEYKDKFMVPAVCYSIATLSSLSRIYDNKHWFTDVLGGAFFGYAMGKLIYNRNNWKVKIEPQVYPDYSGLQLLYIIE